MNLEKRRTSTQADSALSKRPKLTITTCDFTKPSEPPYTTAWFEQVSSNQVLRGHLARSHFMNDAKSLGRESPPAGEVCLICKSTVQENNVTRPSCSHYYHISCVAEWALSLAKPWTTSTSCLEPGCEVDLHQFIVHTLSPEVTPAANMEPAVSEENHGPSHAHAIQPQKTDERDLPSIDTSALHPNGSNPMFCTPGPQNPSIYQAHSEGSADNFHTNMRPEQQASVTKSSTSDTLQEDIGHCDQTPTPAPPPIGPSKPQNLPSGISSYGKDSHEGLATSKHALDRVNDPAKWPQSRKNPSHQKARSSDWSSGSSDSGTDIAHDERGGGGQTKVTKQKLVPVVEVSQTSKSAKFDQSINNGQHEEANAQLEEDLSAEDEDTFDLECIPQSTQADEPDYRAWLAEVEGWNKKSAEEVLQVMYDMTEHRLLPETVLDWIYGPNTNIKDITKAYSEAKSALKDYDTDAIYQRLIELRAVSAQATSLTVTEQNFPVGDIDVTKMSAADRTSYEQLGLTWVIAFSSLCEQDKATRTMRDLYADLKVAEAVDTRRSIPGQQMTIAEVYEEVIAREDAIRQTPHPSPEKKRLKEWQHRKAAGSRIQVLTNEYGSGFLIMVPLNLTTRTLNSWRIEKSHILKHLLEYQPNYLNLVKTASICDKHVKAFCDIRQRKTLTAALDQVLLLMVMRVFVLPDFGFEDSTEFFKLVRKLPEIPSVKITSGNISLSMNDIRSLFPSKDLTPRALSAAAYMEYDNLKQSRHHVQLPRPFFFDGTDSIMVDKPKYDLFNSLTPIFRADPSNDQILDWFVLEINGHFHTVLHVFTGNNYVGERLQKFLTTDIGMHFVEVRARNISVRMEPHAAWPKRDGGLWTLNNMLALMKGGGMLDVERLTVNQHRQRIIGQLLEEVAEAVDPEQNVGQEVEEVAEQEPQREAGPEPASEASQPVVVAGGSVVGTDREGSGNTEKADNGGGSATDESGPDGGDISP